MKDRVPEGISPAAVLGPFRNFQAKLLSAWGRAVLEGNPPANIADLVEAYGRALPAERAEIVRIFVVTTFGGDREAGRRPSAGGEPGRSASRADGAGGRGRGRQAVRARRADALEAPRRRPAGAAGRAFPGAIARDLCGNLPAPQ